MEHQCGIDRGETADPHLQLPQALSFEQKTVLEIVRHPELSQIWYTLVSLLVMLTYREANYL